MSKLVRLTPFAVLALLPAPALAAAGQVWHVDDSGGGDFTTIQEAIDAASNGDTIVVAAGSYPIGITVDAKSLVITASAGATPTLGKIVVRNLAAWQSVAIRRFDASIGVDLDDDLGSVWLEEVEAGFGLVLPGFVPDAIAVDASNCASVVLSRSTALGSGLTGVDGSPGLRAVSSSVHAFETEFRGSSLSSSAGFPAPDGAAPVPGPGVELSSSLFVAAGGLIQGGEGSAGGLCSPGGPGGVGLVAGPGAQAWLLDTEVWGGPGGAGGDLWCPTGPSGTPSVEAGGSIDLLSGFGRDYQLTSPIQGGQSTLLTYDGIKGDLVFSLLSLAPATSFQPALAGTLVVLPPPLIVAHGGVDPDTGKIYGISIAVPVLPPNSAVTVYVQGACVTAVGAAVVCSPSALTIL